MDIRSFKRKDTATVPIQDPLGGKTDIVVEVYGRDSKAYRAAAVELARDFDATDEAKANERGAKLLQACIASWENVEANGKPIKALIFQHRKRFVTVRLDCLAVCFHVFP